MAHSIWHDLNLVDCVEATPARSYSPPWMWTWATRWAPSELPITPTIIDAGWFDYHVDRRSMYFLDVHAVNNKRKQRVKRK